MIVELVVWVSFSRHVLVLIMNDRSDYEFVVG
jgi:hypothetical protein